MLSMMGFLTFKGQGHSISHLHTNLSVATSLFVPAEDTNV